MIDKNLTIQVGGHILNWSNTWRGFFVGAGVALRMGQWMSAFVGASWELRAYGQQAYTLDAGLRWSW